MIVLLDTHVLLWWLFDSPKLGKEVRALIADGENQVYASTASAWEIGTKYRLGKLPEAERLVRDYAGILYRAGFDELLISSHHALHAGMLEINHRDPFDRLLMAQAELENLPIITYDPAFTVRPLRIIPTPQTVAGNET